MLKERPAATCGLLGMIITIIWIMYLSWKYQERNWVIYILNDFAYGQARWLKLLTTEIHHSGVSKSSSGFSALQMAYGSISIN